MRISFYEQNFESVYKKFIQFIKNSPKSKGLFFIDPYGYKPVKPQYIREIMSEDNTEALLFLPISHMYRFANAVLQRSSSRGDPLEVFLKELFDDNFLSFENVRDFIKKLRQQFAEYTKCFVDTFSIERDHSNTYCLFFFTKSRKGFEKMLEAKWNIDTNQGMGFRSDTTIPMFDKVENEFKPLLLDFISVQRTNEEIYNFGLQHGFLPKHSNQILQAIISSIEVVSLDAKKITPNKVYIGNDDRLVGIRLRDSI